MVAGMLAGAGFLSAHVVLPSAGAGRVTTDPALVDVIITRTNEKAAEEAGGRRRVVAVVVVGRILIVRLVLVVNVVLIIGLTGGC